MSNLQFRVFLKGIKLKSLLLVIGSIQARQECCFTAELTAGWSSDMAYNQLLR